MKEGVPRNRSNSKGNAHSSRLGLCLHTAPCPSPKASIGGKLARMERVVALFWLPFFAKNFCVGTLTQCIWMRLLEYPY